MTLCSPAYHLNWKFLLNILHVPFKNSLVENQDSKYPPWFFFRREESIPIFKRRLLGSLLGFSAQELRVQVDATYFTSIFASGLKFYSFDNTIPQRPRHGFLRISLLQFSTFFFYLVTYSGPFRFCLYKIKANSRISQNKPANLLGPMLTLFVIHFTGVLSENETS
jgi:hypothetical protein